MCAVLKNGFNLNKIAMFQRKKGLSSLYMSPFCIPFELQFKLGKRKFRRKFRNLEFSKEESFNIFNLTFVFRN